MRVASPFSNLFTDTIKRSGSADISSAIFATSKQSKPPLDPS
jgi:hypothetical protein